MTLNIPNLCDFLRMNSIQLTVDTNKGCVLKKVCSKKIKNCFLFIITFFQGIYDGIRVDINKYMEMFLGKKFFYGIQGSILELYSNKKRVFCLHCESQLIDPRNIKNVQS